MSAARSGKWLLLILVGAFALRAACALYLQQQLDHPGSRPFLIPGDASGYWQLGRKLAAGGEYAIYDPPRRVLRMPGFPGLLALSIKVFGPHVLPARLVLAAVGTLACGLTYCLGRTLFNEPTGLIASGLTAVCPVMVGFSGLILSETLFAACLLASLWAMAQLVQHEGTHENGTGAQELGLSFVVGLLIAGACYVRPSWLLAGPLFVLFDVWQAGSKKRAVLRGTLVLAGLALALSPWTVRNYRVTGHPVVTTLWVGPSLYDGLNPHATGASDMSFFDRDRLMDSMSEYEMDRTYRRKAWQFVRNHPQRSLELAVIKLGRFWKPWPNAESFDSLGHRLAVAGFFIPVVLLAILGWWQCRGAIATWLLTAGPILYFSLIHMVFVGSLRYRLPAEYPLCVLAAFGLQTWLPAKWQAAWSQG